MDPKEAIIVGVYLDLPGDPEPPDGANWYKNLRF